MRLGVLLTASLLLTGCGYQAGSMMPPGVESIAVGIVENDTYFRQAEVTYTREVTRELIRRAHVDVRDRGQADAILTGRIMTIPRVTLVEDRFDRLLEGGIVVRVEATLSDARTGEPIIEPFVVSRRAEFIVPRPENLQSAIDEAVRDAARDVVHRIQARSFVRER